MPLLIVVVFPPVAEVSVEDGLPEVGATGSLGFGPVGAVEESGVGELEPELILFVDVTAAALESDCVAVEPPATAPSTGVVVGLVLEVGVSVDGASVVDEVSLNANVLSDCIVAASNIPPIIVPTTR